MRFFPSFVSHSFKVRQRAILLSVIVGTALFGIKLLAAKFTGSAAILSDALESIINVVASGFAFFSITLSAQPPDRSHPYGHGKIESFSAGFEGALIILAALAILWKAIPALFLPRSLMQLDFGIFLVLGTAVVNALLGFSLVRTGNHTGSLALIADGKHVLTDVYTSIGVVVGLGLVHVTGWAILDPITACIVALNIIISGVALIRQSVSHLLDAADERILHGIVDSLQHIRRPEWIDVHHLRTWSSGERHHIDFHLTLPRYWNLEQCHAAESLVAEWVVEHLGGQGEVLVHLDPCTSHYCRSCSMPDCALRLVSFRAAIPWTVDSAIGNPRFPYSPSDDLTTR